MNEELINIGKKARECSKTIAYIDRSVKDKALVKAASLLRESKQKIIEANDKDIEISLSKQLSEPMLDRLKLNDSRIENMASSLEKIAEFNDPVGNIIKAWTCKNGLKVKRISVPIGVIGIIYESRPNVTSDAAALCLKSGNVSILRPGSESFNSSKAIIECIHEGLSYAGLDKNMVQQLPTKDRSMVRDMINMTDYIDIIVPRGGKGLCKLVMEESKIPTLLHLDGNCHTYIHKDTNIEKAIKIIVNAKLRRTEICGALESLVIDREISDLILPKIAEELISRGCEIRGEEDSIKIDERIKLASSEDWDTEYLDKIISVKIVHDFKEAVDFINIHSSNHTDAIITENQEIANFFLQQINSAIVMHNTSTQFADGGELGMGSEIGIATGKIHARGPVALEQLTTYKYIIESEGAIRNN